MSSPFGSHGNALLAGHSVGIKPHSWKSVKPGLSTKVNISPSIGADFALVDAYSVNLKDMICAAP